jgi:hypothetical protein
MATPLTQYSANIDPATNQELLDEMMMLNAAPRQGSIAAGGMQVPISGGNPEVGSAQAMAFGPTSAIPQFASLEAAMMNRQAVGVNQNNPWTGPMAERALQERAVEAEEAYRLEQDNAARAQAMKSRMRNANMLAASFGVDISDPEQQAAAAGISSLLERKAPKEVIEAAIAKAGWTAPDIAKNLATEKGFRDEFNKLQVDFMKVHRANQRVQVSGVNPTAAGDLSLLFNYMKMLDPGSVVRESEFATAARAGSYGDRMKGAVNQVVNGKRLSENQRADFMQKADELYGAAVITAQDNVDAYTRIANNAGVDANNVIATFQETQNNATEKPPVKRGAPQEAVDLLMSDPSPEAKAEFQDIFGYLPEGL